VPPAVVVGGGVTWGPAAHTDASDIARAIPTCQPRPQGPASRSRGCREALRANPRTAADSPIRRFARCRGASRRRERPRSAGRCRHGAACVRGSSQRCPPRHARPLSHPGMAQLARHVPQVVLDFSQQDRRRAHA
jgi:hypothetical protein